MSKPAFKSSFIPSTNFEEFARQTNDRIRKLAESQENGKEIPCTNVRQCMLDVERLINNDVLIDREILDKINGVAQNCSNLASNIKVRIENLRQVYIQRHYKDS